MSCSFEVRKLEVEGHLPSYVYTGIQCVVVIASFRDNFTLRTPSVYAHVSPVYALR